MKSLRSAIPFARSFMSNVKYSSASEPSALVTREQKSIAVVTLNRPKQLNSLNLELIERLAKIFREIRDDREVKAVILTGAGKAFSAGVDLNTAADIFQGKVNIFGTDSDPVFQMQQVPVPIIGAINGFAITGGFELALQCDFLIGSTNAQFMDTHAKFGIHPAWGLSQILPRLIGPGRAMEVSMTSNPVDAATAEKWGLITRVVPPDDLMPTALKLAQAIAANNGPLVKKYKKVIREGFNCGLADGLLLERQRGVEYYKTMTPEQFAAFQKFISGRSDKKDKK